MNHLSCRESALAPGKSIEFGAWAGDLLDAIGTKVFVLDPLRRASASTPLPIGQINATVAAVDRCRFFEAVASPAPECSGCLDTMDTRLMVSFGRVKRGMAILVEAIEWVTGLLGKAARLMDAFGDGVSPWRLREGMEEQGLGGIGGIMSESKIAMHP